MIKILLASGGSGGHIFPAYALSEELEKRFNYLQIIFAISGRPEERRIAEYIKNRLKTMRILIIPISPLRRSFLNFFIFLFNFIKGSIYSFLFILLFRPHIAVGFGGILSLPLILSASLLRIPTLIHEQNIYPGKANRLLYYFVQKVALSFEESKNYFKDKKLFVTGNPLRPDLAILDKEEALHKLGLSPHLFTILILGGSQGAKRINEHFLDVWEEMKKKNLFFQVIHLTGLKDWEWVLKRYEEIKIPAKVFSFYEDIGTLFSAVDLVIGRGGASTLNEISFFAKPAMVIPYPYAQKHQLFNALYYAKKEAIILIEEKDLDREKTCKLIYDIMEKKEIQKLLSEKIKSLSKPLATRMLADTVEEMLERRYA